MARKNTERILQDHRMARGLDRKAHFAAGGTPADWRGLHLVEKDRRKEASRKACRTRGEV